MNAQQINAAAKKHGPLKTAGATRDEVSIEIKKDLTKITAGDLKKVLDKIFAEPAAPAASASAATTGTGSATPAKSKKASADQPSPNDKIEGLDKFDYKKLTGKHFREYINLVGDFSFVEIDEETGKPVGIAGQLAQNDEYDFVQLKCQPVMKDRFPGVEGTPRDYVGLKIINDEPVHVSRIPVRVALQFNSQILNQHSMAGHGKYYFLKQK